MHLTKFAQIWVKDSDSKGSLVQGLCVVLPELQEGQLPADIQLFPPGEHEIDAMREGKPDHMRFVITPKTADAIRSAFGEMMADANAGNGPKPYTDFNHEDRQASAWIQDVYWGGDDPKTGGVRAKVEWTSDGAAAIKGKTFRQFSPNFLVSRDTGEIIGTTANMGGLVNRPAFKKIEPLFAKDAGTASQPKTKAKAMNKIYEALVAAGLLSAIPTDETAATADFSAKWAGVSAKLAKVPDLEKQIGTLTQTVTAKETALTEATTKYTTLAAKHADTVIAKAVSDGILAPKDENAKGMWHKLIVADPSNEALLGTFNVQAKAAQGGVGQADVTKPIVTDANGSAAAAAAAATNGKGEHAFTVLAKAIADRDKCDMNTALVTAARQNPAAYEAYRKGILFQP